MSEDKKAIEIDITDERENLLLRRKEIWFKIRHDEEPTPIRDDVITQFVRDLGVPRERIIIDHMRSEFGMPETKGYAKVYGSKDDALYYESKAVLVRNKLITEEKKSEKKEE